ncbi:histidine phosphatase family protein [Pseudofrankia sp. BMG5.36]|uniref:histidine phosphatase family protein n=1 Tax=Pseudofrankia sp. BMG5.36 TaxID=1834512 RepID=UPI0008DA881F|nr:histidine phosphatase family protein [Pseudofrankia sp. BMG5.36]OHV43452.1 phosphoglycerate mutase [Pseudofrankia sp. BMG5.36]
MTDLFLVRHGETEWHSENRYAGVSDVALTDRGRAQARQLAAWAQTARLSAIWASTLSRARLTAQVCADQAGAELRLDARLRELDFGDGEGLTAAEMTEQFPEALDAFRADPVAQHLPGGEDPAHAALRFTQCLTDIAADHPTGRILIVAHTTAIRLALCQILGVPLREYRRLFPYVRNCSLTELRLHDEQFSVIEFNTPIDRADYRQPAGDRAEPLPIAGR